MRAFDLLQPSSSEEAVALLERYGDEARLLGGGAMLTVLVREGLLAARYLISVTGIPGLDGITVEDGQVTIGAASTLRTVVRSSEVRERWSVLAEAAHLVGNVRVRNVGTIGGHLAQADVHLDLPPVLVALGAAVEIRGPGGPRIVPLADFFVGYYETVLGPDEMVASVTVPVPDPNLHGVYLKYCALSPNDWPTVGVAAFMRNDGGRALDVRVVAGSVAERPLRLTEAEALLEGESIGAETLREMGRRYAEAADPIADATGSAEYKREVTAVYVRRAIAVAGHRAGLLTDRGVA